jgi:hypothetical protein
MVGPVGCSHKDLEPLHLCGHQELMLCRRDAHLSRLDVMRVPQREVAIQG